MYSKKGLSEKFHVGSGIRQGCVLSLLLFITYIDQICKIANISEGNNCGELLNGFIFADNQATEEQLQ
uniref:Reverse transcriptase domain-containing protein n=1 Tax=Arion vulgaris TaxID=1028688 RepID=A0A0B7BP12_9EUPU